MARRMEKILWARKSQSLSDFMESHQNDLPKIVIFKQIPPALGTLQKDQVLHLGKISKQKRVKATDLKGTAWSIPTDYPIKINILRQGVYSPAQTIADISDPLPVRVKFDSDYDGKFHFAGEITEVELGLLTIESLHEETYLLGNCINKGVVEGRVIAVPTPCKAIVGVAQGFGNDSNSQADWITFQQILGSVIEEFGTDHVTGCSEIRELPNSGQPVPGRILLCSADPDKLVSCPQVMLDERLPPEPPPCRPSRPRTFEKINECRDVRWSEKDYTLKEFFEEFSEDLPQIVIVTSGFYGPTDLETFGVDEIMRITRYCRQQRVIAMDPTEQYMSIPVTYPVKMEIIKEHGKVSKPMTLEQIIKRTLPIKVRFNQKSSGSFYTQSDSSSYSMKELQIMDTYNETYYIGNSLLEGKLGDKVLAMPIYVDIDIAVAQGWRKKSDEEWEKYLKSLKVLEAEFDYDVPTVNKNIAMYSPGQVNVGDNIYEYIIPQDYVSMSEEAPAQHKAPQKAPTPCPAPRPGGTSKTSSLSRPYCTTQIPTTPVDNEYVKLMPSLSLKKNPEAREQSVKVRISPKLPEHEASFPTQPSPKPTSPQAQSPNPKSPGATTPPTPGGVRVLPLPVPPKSENARAAKQDRARDKFEKTQYANSNRSSGLVFQYPGDLGKAASGGGTEAQADRAATGAAGSPPSNLIIRHVRDIPLDASCLTVEELCDCLTLLGLGKYMDSFRKLQIDGSLLSDLTADDLRNDPNFGLSVTEAKMLVRFAKNGWRPKHS